MVNITAVDYDADSSRDDIFLSLEGDLRDFFTIDSADGRIFVSQQGVGKIDREKYEIIYLKVGAQIEFFGTRSVATGQQESETMSE